MSLVCMQLSHNLRLNDDCEGNDIESSREKLSPRRVWGSKRSNETPRTREAVYMGVFIRF